MDDEVKEKTMELLDVLDSQADVEVTTYDIIEYTRGDPTTASSESTGAEISITCYYSTSYNPGDNDDSSRFRVK